MRILKREQIYKADQATISNQGITSYELMERAAGKVFQWLQNHCDKDRKYLVFCGIGNNGGDGLVIAGKLLEQGYDIQTFVVNYSNKRSDDFLEAKRYFEEEANGKLHLLKESDDLPEITRDCVVVDAIFGIGYDRPAAPWVQNIFKTINTSNAFVVAVDIPSGLYLDAVPGENEFPVQADQLLSFQVPKLIFFLPQTGKFIKKWTILDIGLDQNFIETTNTPYQVITPEKACKLYRSRDKYTHKGTYGHGLIIGGGYGKIGATLISAKACLKSGSGLVSAYLPQFAMPIMQSALPEVMVLTDRHDGKHLEEIHIDLEADAIGIGMGMGTEPITIEAFKEFLSQNNTPLVVDADALNCLAKKPELLDLLPKQSILTPHPKELKRLIGEWKDDFDKLEKIRDFSAKYDLVIVAKGANTITVYENSYFINDNGNPGMATGGTGDALTGIITGLRAQGYDALEASLLGVYLHGSAGDHAATKLGYEALTAGDLVDHLGAAYLEFYKD